MNNKNNKFTTHDKLQYTAYKWLKKQGYTCNLETCITNSNHGRYIVDVCGRRGNEIVIIECGNTPMEKITTLSKIFDKVYVWSFGKLAPQLYPKHKKQALIQPLVCPLCGHATSNNDIQFNPREFMTLILNRNNIIYVVHADHEVITYFRSSLRPQEIAHLLQTTEDKVKSDIAQDKIRFIYEVPAR